MSRGATHVIQQSVQFSAAPATLYTLFADSMAHSAATGMPAKISRKVGGEWSAFGGMIHGRNLVLIPGRMIVQTWRGLWKKSSPDSILIVTFSKASRGGRVHLTHVKVPSYDQKGVRQGWPKYYWKPWRAYLAKRKRA
jgi:activator of HSP90 ATPase